MVHYLLQLSSDIKMKNIYILFCNPTATINIINEFFDISNIDGF